MDQVETGADLKNPPKKISFAKESEKITTFALLKVGHKAKPKNAKLKKINFKNLLQQT